MQLSTPEKDDLVFQFSFSIMGMIEKKYSKLMLLDEYFKPKNILEVLMFGSIHLTRKIRSVIGENNPYAMKFDELLDDYKRQYFKIHNLKTSAVDINMLIQDRKLEYKLTLKTFVYNHPGDIVPAREYNMLWLHPLEYPVSIEVDENFYLFMGLMVKSMHYFIDTLNDVFDGMKINLGDFLNN